jgi:hypothetical protein
LLSGYREPLNSKAADEGRWLEQSTSRTAFCCSGLKQKSLLDECARSGRSAIVTFQRCLHSIMEMQYPARVGSIFNAGDKMDEQHSDLDELQADYKAAVEKWVTTIRKEEALASVNHSVAEVDLWEDAGFQEDAMRNVVKESKAKYEDALREKFFGF